MNLTTSIDDIKGEKFKDLLNKETVFSLFKEITLNNYIDCSPGYEHEIIDLLKTTYEKLNGSKSDEKRLEESVKYLVDKIFKKNDHNFWFNQIYKNYKRNIKPQKRYSFTKNLIKGNRVLDVGCGDGLFSCELKKNNYQVFMTDILDYRDNEAKQIPFKKMGDCVNILPFPDKFVDTTILFSVLHHIDEDKLSGMLNELKRVSSRIIIEENCFNLSSNDNIDSFGEVLKEDIQLQRFLSLSKEDQFSYLMLSDYFSNSIGQGIIDMNFPFEFKTISEWKSIFNNN